MRPLILKGQKVFLGVLLKEDLSKSWWCFNERSTARALFSSAYFTLQEEFEEMKKNKEKMPTFAVVENGSGKLVGVAGFNWVNYQPRWGPQSPEDRGKGYGSEVVALLVGHALNHLNLHKVWAKVYTDNRAPIRILEKNEFVLAGRLRDHVWSDNRWTSPSTS